MPSNRVWFKNLVAADFAKGRVTLQLDRVSVPAGLCSKLRRSGIVCLDDS